LRAGDVDQWQIFLVRAELLFSLGCDLACTIRDSIVRLPSRCGLATIHISPMSLTWLRVYEAEYDKHPVEL
jgi:hypothetical protein